MSLFGEKKISIADSGLTAGFTDYHSHILYGLDDGVKTVEESLEILALYEKLGVRELWFTPHIMDDVPNTTDGIKGRFSEMVDAYRMAAESENRAVNGSISLNVAAEYMLDPLFEKRLEENDILPVGEMGMHILVETSFYNPPYNFWEIFDKIKSKGYYPILAHPERYAYLSMKEYEKLKDMGVKFQLNLGSTIELYSPESRKTAEKLSKKGFYNISGSDTHSLPMLSKILSTKRASVKTIESIKGLAL